VRACAHEKKTVSDIHKAKDKLKKCVSLCDADAPNKPKNMKMAQESSLLDAILKLYVQQCSCGVNV
jgi:hypothetical protein